MTQQLQNIIDTAWEQRAEINPSNASAQVRDAVAHVLAGLDNGTLLTVLHGGRARPWSG